MINLFPTPLNIVENNSVDTKDLVDHCINLSKQVERGGEHWLSKNVFNSSYTHNIYKDSKFKDLNNWIAKEVNLFANALGFKKLNLDKTNGWFNLYNKKDYQEWHNHNFALISVIYYLKANSNSAKTHFKSPLPDNPNTPDFNPSNIYTWKTYFIEPKQDTLVIFKSDLDHSVEAQKEDLTRITLAYNFYD